MWTKRVSLRVLGAAARVHAPRLEVAAVGAARDLAIGALPGQPDLEVVGLARRRSRCRPQHSGHDAVGQLQPLQHRLGAADHALVLGLRLLRRGDADQLDLVELVLADHAPGVLAGGAGLGAEAGRQAVSRSGRRASSTISPATRLVSGTSAVGISQWPLVGPEQIVGELRQLAGAEQRLVAHQIAARRPRCSRARRVCRSSMNWPSARSSRGELAPQHHEPRARQLGGARRNPCPAPRPAPRAAAAGRRSCAARPSGAARRCGARRGRRARRRPACWESRPARASSRRLQLAQALLALPSPAPSARPSRPAAPAPGARPCAERWPISRDSRLRVGLVLLQPGLERAALRIERQHGGGRRRLAAPGQRLVEGVGIARAAT